MITELARPSDQTGFLPWCASGIPRNKSNQRIMWLKINFSCQGTAKHPASFPVFLGYFWRDVTRQACRENSRYRTWFQASSGKSDSANWPGYEAAKHPTVPQSPTQHETNRLDATVIVLIIHLSGIFLGSISAVSRVRSLILPEEDECGLIFPNSGW